ncbi:MAG: DUF4168 domain-containing protein [Balneolaceae bacterium]
MNTFKIAATFIIIALLGAGPLFAQGQAGQQMPDLPSSSEVSDDELERFIDTRIEMEPVQLQMQNDMQEAIEEEMDIERFQQLLMAMQNPQMAGNVQMTDEEQQTIQGLQPVLIQIQMDAQPELIEIIEDNGFEIERFEVLMTAIQQDDELFSRFQQKIQEIDQG